MVKGSMTHKEEENGSHSLVINLYQTEDNGEISDNQLMAKLALVLLAPGISKLLKQLEEPLDDLPSSLSISQYLDEQEDVMYHITSEAQYEELMQFAESNNYKWNSGDSPREFDAWGLYKEKLVITLENKKLFCDHLDMILELNMPPRPWGSNKGLN